MIAGAPALERSLRRRIRGELRASPSLWRDYKIHKKSRPRVYKSGWVLRVLVPFAGLALLSQTKLPWMDRAVFLSLTLYLTGSAFLRASLLLRGLWASQELVVLSQYPVSDGEFFDLQWKRFVRSSAWLFYTPALIYVFVAGLRGNSERAAEGGLILGAFQWSVSLGLAAGLAAWRPRWRLPQFGMALCVAAGVVMILTGIAGPRLAAIPGNVLLAFPAGWVTVAFRDGILGNAPTSLAWAGSGLAALAGLAVVVLARRRIRAGYIVSEIRTYRPAAEVILEQRVRQEVERERAELQGPPLTAVQQAEARQDVMRSVPAENQDRIRAGAFLPVYDWSREGFLERLTMRFLTRRERIVAELMAGPRLKMTGRWKKAAALMVIGVLVALAVPHVPQFILIALAAFFSLTAFQGNRPGFFVVPSAGKFMPVHAVQPVEYREVSRLFFKMTVIFLAAWTPLAAAFGAAMGHRAPLLGATAGLIIALKAAWILLSIQPVSMVARFSSGSNDTERLTLRGCFGLILPFLLLGLPGLAGAVCTFALPGSWWLIGAGAAPLSAWALWAFYGAVYNRGRIDLIRSTQGAVQN